jgi:hypothetical protein
MTSADLAQLAELVAERVAELTPGALPARLLTAREVAERLGVEREWVYEHAAQLRARRLGGGSKPRLRFVWADVLAAVPCPEGRRSGEAATTARTRMGAGKGRAETPSGAPLLPIRQRAPVPDSARQRPS